MPDGTSRFSLEGRMLRHYMGCSTFANYTVLPEIALAKIREDAPFDKVCYIGCGVTTGVGAVIEVVGGALIAVGLFTRVAAFVCSGMLAVAYFQFHWKLDLSGLRVLPVVNQGGFAALYAFVFLYIATRGPGRLAIDQE